MSDENFDANNRYLTHARRIDCAENFAEIKKDLDQLRREDTRLDRRGDELAQLRNWLNKQFTEIRVDIASLKVKASIWGALGGLGAVAITVGIAVLMYIVEK